MSDEGVIFPLIDFLIDSFMLLIIYYMSTLLLVGGLKNEHDIGLKECMIQRKKRYKKAIQGNVLRQENELNDMKKILKGN